MQTQQIIVAFLFLAAVFYIGRIVVRMFQTKKGCGTNCKCGVDFSEINPPK